MKAKKSTSWNGFFLEYSSSALNVSSMQFQFVPSLLVTLNKVNPAVSRRQRWISFRMEDGISDSSWMW